MKTNPCTDCVENVKGLCLVEAEPIEDIARPDECKSYAPTDCLATIRAEVVKWRDELTPGEIQNYIAHEIYNKVLALIDGEATS